MTIRGTRFRVKWSDSLGNGPSLNKFFQGAGFPDLFLSGKPTRYSEGFILPPLIGYSACPPQEMAE